jgi:hypothetical protein
MSRKLQQVLWQAVNAAVLPQARNLYELYNAPSGGPGVEKPLAPLAELAVRAGQALKTAAPKQRPPVDAAVLACLDNADKVFRGIQFWFLFYLLLNAGLAIVSIGLFTLGGVSVILGIRDNVELLKTILGSVAAVVGLAGTFYTKPLKMVLRAVIIHSKVKTFCQSYKLKIADCKAGKDLTRSDDLRQAVKCVTDLFEEFLTRLDKLAAEHDK